MLQFYKNSTHYFVLETRHGFFDTEYMILSYTKDLEESQIDRNPVNKTSQAAKDWFRRNYILKF
jgi:hypothetical protein